MKHKFLTLMLLMLATIAKANPVDMNTAREVAVKFLNANTKTPLRGTDELQLATTYNTSHGDVAFHVFNTPNGFVIVSADDCATPILGYSDEGRPFEPDNVPIQLQVYLQGYVDQMEYDIENHIVGEQNTVRQWELVKNTGRLNENRSYDAVEPLVTAMWDQGCYYNAMCPEDPYGYCGGHVPTGCGPTAMGMIMHYWGFPLHGTGSITHQWDCHNSLGQYYPVQYVNFAEATYDWANMPDQLDENSTQDEINAVATLLWHCGVALEAMYKPQCATVITPLIPRAFNNYYGYTDACLLYYDVDVHDYFRWIDLLKSNLLLAQPILYTGNNESDGHGWVCDGYDANDLFHFNWGWSGIGNGYFHILSHSFSYFQGVVINIYPSCDNSIAYQIEAVANNDTAGSITGMGTYSCNQMCNLSAVANEGYSFSNWTENGEIVSYNPIYSFTVYENRSLVANFVNQNEYIVSVVASPENGGTVEGGGNYALGQECTLSAVADNGYIFSYWTKSGVIVSYESNYVFTVVADQTLVAHFCEEECSSYTVSVTSNPSEGGSVVGNGTYEEGATCILTAIPDPGYSFVNWTENGEVVSTESMYLFSVYNDRGLTANFTLPFEISATADPSEYGANISGIGFYIYRQSCTLTAENSDDFCFYYWIEGWDIVSMDSAYSFVVTSNRNLVAIFGPKLNISATANPEEGTVSGEGVYNYNQICSLHAIPNDGYCFYYWTENGEIVSMDETYSFEVRTNRNLVAHFGFPLSVSAVANPEEGSVSGEGIYNYNQLCVLNATPNDGYSFSHWMENGTLVSHNANLSFNVRSSRNLMAVFEEKVDTISGLLNGWFSVSADRQVQFSKGNLQYIGSATEPYWKFADNQYDYLGDNGQFSSDEYVDRDLFGWGTSGYNHGAVCYQPWSTSQIDSDYDAYGSVDLNLYDQNGQADWGFNAISNGGNTTNQWRTLKTSEWDYLINKRHTQSGIRYVKARVNDINGLIILPDNWSEETYSFSYIGGQHYDYYEYNIISAISWDTLESAGAVFLPESGLRVGVTSRGTGAYVSADRYPYMPYVDCLAFNNVASPGIGAMDLSTGLAVRLVRYHPEQPIYYVAQNGTGDGSSWNDAMGDLQVAMDFAALGQGVVWVAEGTYYGDSVSENAFTIPDGVRVYGGFAGDEPEDYDLSLRNFAAHPTILDGQHTQRTVYHEYPMEWSSVPRVSPILDGFTIQNGHNIEGGNVFGGNPMLQLNNCVIQNGESENGDLVCAIISNSIIVNNIGSGWWTGWAGVVMAGCNAYNCVIANNHADAIASGSTLVNCILWNNIGTPEWICNISYSAIEGQEISGEGNILLAHSNNGISPDSLYVSFIDPENGDFRLSCASDCINMGTPDISELDLPQVDLQGNPRVMDGRIDMGAYEFDPSWYSVVTVSANPAEGGTVTPCGSGIYENGIAITLTATANEGYTFLYWIANGALLSTNPTCTLTVAGNTNCVARFISDDATVQTTSFNNGWNWYSTYIEQNGIDGLEQLEESLGANDVQIKAQVGYANYYEGIGWLGTLTSINNESSYKIKTTNPCVVEMLGEETTPSAHPITIGHGWNWIGYPINASMSLTTALSGITPIEGDQLKAQNGYATYYNNLGWVGTLNTINPGMGLLYKSNSNNNFMLVYPTNSKGETLIENITPENNHWVPNMYTYPDNMTVTAVVELDGKELQSDNYELGAFADGECRGSVRLMYIEPIQRYIAFLTVVGKEVETLSFGLYDTTTGEEIYDAQERLNFSNNAIVGSVNEPYVVSFSGVTGIDEWGSQINVFPNPVARGENITIVPTGVETLRAMSSVHVEIINALGVLVETRFIASSQTIAAPNTAGVYTLRITIEGKGTYYRKLVVR